MNKIERFVGYHATDRKNVDSILNDNFIISKNPKQWLGFGVYFFLDRELAKWWATNPTKQFGCMIEDPVIIKSNIEVQENKILDLRDLKQHRFMRNRYKEFNKIFKSGNLKPINVGTIFNQNDVLEAKSYSRDILECLFFNWLVSNYDIKMIIASFYKPNPTYLNEYSCEIDHRLRVIFPEEQVCVVDINMITENEVEEVSNV